MKKIIKKLLTTACTLVLCLVCLSGCSWLKIDNARYYNQVVVSIGKKEFLKKDLLEAFNSYGYQYVQSYGYSMEQAVNSTIDSMIDRYLLMEEAKKVITLSPEEELQIKKEAFDYMQDSIGTYEKQVRTEWKLDLTINGAEEKAPLRDAETEYTPKVTYDEIECKVVRVKDIVDVDNVSNLPAHFSKNYQVPKNKDVYNEAWTRYVKALQDGAKEEGRDSSESKVLLHEEERLIKLLTDNKILDKYQELFLDGVEVNTSAVVKYFKEKYLDQKRAFDAKESLYHTAMQKASSEYVYYHPNSGNEYVNVKHILINFNDSQKNAITALDKRLENKEISQNYYDQEKQRILNTVKSTFEMDGETYTWTGYEIYDYVKDYVTGSSLKTKARKFNELVYIFNDDPGMMNSEFDYVVNLDTTVTDQMVKPFADGVRALDESNGGDGAGSMDMIVSEYGFHIIFHAGVKENLIDDANFDNYSDEQLISILCSNYTTPESGKSIFQYLYDTIGLADKDDTLYNTKTEEVVENAETNLKNNDIKIDYYVNNYKDLYE